MGTDTPRGVAQCSASADTASNFRLRRYIRLSKTSRPHTYSVTLDAFPYKLLARKGKQYVHFLLLTSHGTENSLKVFSVAVDIQQWVSFALLPNYKIVSLLTLHGTENSLKVFGVAMEMQQWVSFALLPNYKIVSLLTLHGN